MDYAALFESNLALIDRVIGAVCRRMGLYGADAEDFASAAKLALIEDDYAVLRPFEGRSSLSTFLVVIIQRFFVDEKLRRSGRWHASREAERLGEAGLALERIVRREQRTIDEALPILQSIDPTLTRERVVEMEARLPQRGPRPRAVDLEAAEGFAAVRNHDDERALVSRIDGKSDRTAHAVRQTLGAMSLEDRMIIRMHYGESITISNISRLLRLPQRPLYRRLQSLLQTFRTKLASAGIDAGDVAEMIGSATREMEFGLDDGKTDLAWPTNLHETPGIEEAR